MRVRAVNGVGESPPSAEVSGTPREEPIWSATLTVGTTEDFAGYTTFLSSENSNILGTLSHDTFTSDDASYTVKALGVLDGMLILSVMPKLTAEFVLVAGTEEFASTDASTLEGASLLQYQWDNPGLDWSDEEEVAVSLTKPDENSAATGTPAISGTPQVEQTLTADTSSITDEDGLTSVSYRYQWIAGGSDIGGATGSSYLLTSSEQGQTIQVRVTFTDDAENEESLTSVATAAVAAKANTAPTGLPSISGTPQVDQTLTADTSNIDDEDGLTNVSYRYQWSAGGSDIEGATGSTYTLTYSEQGQTIQVQVSFTDDADNEETLTSAATVAVAAAPNRGATGQPTISGTPQVGQTLTADTSNIADLDGITNPTFAYQWRGGGLTIIGATGSTYTLTASDQGKTITVRVRFIDDRNSIESRISNATTAVAAAPNREATGKPTIGGTPQVDQTLTADTANIADEDGLTNVSYSYQWIAGGSDIAGATGSSFTLTASQQGKTIQVRVAFTDDRGNAEILTSEATAEVAAAPDPLTVRLKVAAPATQDGSSEFTFEIEFSEEVKLSYATLKNHAFNVTGGSVERAQRTGQAQQHPLARHGKAARHRGRDHRTPGNHRLRRPGSDLHRGRQETVQLAELHRIRAGPVGDNKQNRHTSRSEASVPTGNRSAQG